MFIWNVIRSLRKGEPAGNNPWGGDTLEWATSSPPAEHGWSVLPIVHSRHPMWDQDDLHSGDERLVRFVRGPGRMAAALAGGGDRRALRMPGRRRCSASPARRSGRSWRPAGVVLIFIAELVKLRWIIAIAVVTVVVAPSSGGTGPRTRR